MPTKAILQNPDQTFKPNADTIVIYTDGGCRNHGNKLHDHVHDNDPSGWAFSIQNQNHIIKEASGSSYGHTNNQMEMTAVINAFKYLIDHQYQNKELLLVSDSTYILDAIISQRLDQWFRQNWRLDSPNPIKNVDLWKMLHAQLYSFSDLHFKWTKGHADNQGNNRVDHLLNIAMDNL